MADPAFWQPHFEGVHFVRTPRPTSRSAAARSARSCTTGGREPRAGLDRRRAPADAVRRRARPRRRRRRTVDLSRRCAGAARLHDADALRRSALARAAGRRAIAARARCAAPARRGRALGRASARSQVPRRALAHLHRADAQAGAGGGRAGRAVHHLSLPAAAGHRARRAALRAAAAIAGCRLSSAIRSALRWARGAARLRWLRRLHGSTHAPHSPISCLAPRLAALRPLLASPLPARAGDARPTRAAARDRAVRRRRAVPTWCCAPLAPLWTQRTGQPLLSSTAPARPAASAQRRRGAPMPTATRCCSRRPTCWSTTPRSSARCPTTRCATSAAGAVGPVPLVLVRAGRAAGVQRAGRVPALGARPRASATARGAGSHAHLLGRGAAGAATRSSTRCMRRIAASAPMLQDLIGGQIEAASRCRRRPRRSRGRPPARARGDRRAAQPACCPRCRHCPSSAMPTGVRAAPVGRVHGPGAHAGAGGRAAGAGVAAPARRPAVRQRCCSSPASSSTARTAPPRRRHAARGPGAGAAADPRARRAAAVRRDHGTLRSTRVRVIGGSVAGLLAARVLADHAREVVWSSATASREHPSVPRKGVPQAHHAHALLASGQRAIEALCPGSTRSLIERGAAFGGGSYYTAGGYLHAPARDGSLFASRGAARGAVRRLCSHGPICACSTATSRRAALRERPRRGPVRGAAGRRRQPRRSRPTWWSTPRPRLARRRRGWPRSGYAAPPLERVEVGMRYASRHVRRAAERLGGRCSSACRRRRGQPRACGVLAHGGRGWIVTLIGYFGDQPPPTTIGFLAFARSLPAPRSAELLATCRTADVDPQLAFAANQRLRTSGRGASQDCS